MDSPVKSKTYIACRLTLSCGKMWLLDHVFRPAGEQKPKSFAHAKLLQRQSHAHAGQNQLSMPSAVNGSGRCQVVSKSFAHAKLLDSGHSSSLSQGDYTSAHIKSPSGIAGRGGVIYLRQLSLCNRQQLSDAVCCRRCPLD